MNDTAKISPIEVFCPKCLSCPNVKCTGKGRGIISRVMIDTFHEERISAAAKKIEDSAQTLD